MINGDYVTFELTDGTSFMFRMASGQVVPRLLTMEFKAEDNPVQLFEDVGCTIVGDSVVECWLPSIVDNKQLVARFTIDGDEVTIGGELAMSGNTRHDYKTPQKLTVMAAREEKDYSVYVHAFTGLPVLWIETKERAEVMSKEEYVDAKFRLVEDVVTRSAGDVVEVEGQIKGRGNSTWLFPKKPYRLKLNEKTGFLGEAKDKAWVLLANYADKTQLRNSVAFYMSSISNLDYTPRSHFVEVMLNGRYNGTYQLCEKVKVSDDRVNVGDEGYLLEVDARVSEEADGRYFYVDGIENLISIKHPAVEFDDIDYTFIRDYVKAASTVLFRSYFTNPDRGWQKYLDMDSFVDWYLINEICKNSDAVFYTSCFMHKTRAGKLKMGPVWDFDISLGNVDYVTNYDPEGFWIKQVKWYNRLLMDPAFVERVKERFDYFYSRRYDIIMHINDDAKYLRRSAAENNNRWGTLYNYTWPNYDIWGSYENEVQWLKNWLLQRFEWLKGEFDGM